MQVIGPYPTDSDLMGVGYGLVLEFVEVPQVLTNVQPNLRNYPI
jgi:hypothetical protein